MVPSTSSEQKNNPRFFSLSTKKISGKFWKSTQKLVENGIRLPYSNDAKDLIDILLREGAQLYEEGQKLNANLNGMEQQNQSMQQAHHLQSPQNQQILLSSNTNIATNVLRESIQRQRETTKLVLNSLIHINRECLLM